MGWLDKLEDGGKFDGLTNRGFNYNGAWGGQFAMGGSLPGSVGFTYARTKGIPYNGPGGKKTVASAKSGKVVKDNMGYWNPANWGKTVQIDSNDITMRGVRQPLLGISDTGDMKYMHPGQDYKFEGTTVTEIPVAKDGSQLKKLDQLTNFTNYNTKQPGGWLDNL